MLQTKWSMSAKYRKLWGREPSWGNTESAWRPIFKWPLWSLSIPLALPNQKEGAEAVVSSGVPLTSSFLIMSSPGGRKHYQAKTILHSSAKCFCQFPLVSGFLETWKGNLYKNHTIFLRFCSPWVNLHVSTKRDIGRQVLGFLPFIGGFRVAQVEKPKMHDYWWPTFTAVCIILWNSTFFCASSREVSHSQTKEIKHWILKSDKRFSPFILSFMLSATLVLLYLANS